MKKLASAIDPLWYKDAIIYEIHVRAFADSNGDGIGDFPGLISRLDYLQDLGITCIWLLPFFPSPLRDDGYDIANYVDVNPSYGTLDDFKTFLDAAHQRNMQVMIELVINHTSDQHPWFKAARLAPPGSPERDMYVWSVTDQLFKDARIIFTDTEKSNWTWDETAKAYYWHRFFSHQPDLNYDNPLVLEEVLKAMRFWLDMGVDALRMDAIPYLVERDGTSCENLPETHTVVKRLRAAIDVEYANRFVLAEANQWPADVRPYFGDGDECHMAFHFPLMPRIYMSLRREDRLPITDIMAQTPPIPENCQWGLFLRNHDELTLEMVTDDERDYMYFAYSADPRMRVNVGIRRRLAPLVDNNRHRIELLNSLLFSFPGTPIIYYGDEIGMGDNIYLGDRNGVRTPMQWTSDRNAGFSRCDPARLYFPVIMDPIYGYQVVNVEAQLSDQSSLLHWTRNMIALRKLFQVFGRGTLTFLNPSNRKVLAYVRDLVRDDGSHETVLCVANLSRFAQPVSLDLSDYIGQEPIEMLGYVPFPIISKEPYDLSLAPYSFLWLEIQPASVHAEPQLESEEELIAQQTAGEGAALELIRDGWAGLMSGRGVALLESALPGWLAQQRWFGAKSRKVQSVRILEWTELADRSGGSGAGRSVGTEGGSAVCLVEVTYNDGPPEAYQVPLAFSTRDAAEDLAANQPKSVVVTFPSSSGPVTVHDATILESFRRSVLELIGRNGTLGLSRVRASSASPGGAGDPGALAADNTGLVAPVPIDAQPGEAASSPRTDAETAAATSGGSRDPRESPLAGRTGHADGQLMARAAGKRLNEDFVRSAPSSLGSAEQSNTSVLYGRELILKLFRRLQTGENPDVEIGRFLTDTAHFPHIAPFRGDISVVRDGGEKTTVAMLQGLVENVGDGWAWFLDQLAEFFPSVAGLGGPPEAPAPSFLSDLPVKSDAEAVAGTALSAAKLLGRRTAEMHLALAMPTSDSAFAAETLSPEDLTRDARRIDAQITSTLGALKLKISALSDQISDQAALLLSQRINLFTRANAIAGSHAAGQCIRIHGDYHLGQTLRVEGSSLPATERTGDFILLDFEGEPARPFSERRQKQSPLKDVAGMLRSFSYAAHAGLEGFAPVATEAGHPHRAESLTAWAVFWENSVSTSFLQAYRETISANSALLPSPVQSQAMLAAYMLEKALYELLYELNNRPDWLHIPLAGILAL
ncbi:MAG TPA: maltose alpha-D-glucosyltransferase [Terracidiphilus sp.]|nr:maltose alpha-D-glucosyltransferase [Terracidiphilus sp.]